MKKISKILVVILALSLMLGALVVLSSATEAATPKLGAANVVYGDQLSLVFAVTESEYEVLGVVAYAAETDAAEKISYKLDKTDAGFYQTRGIAAKDIEEIAYYAVQYKDGDTVKYSDMQAYSIDTYLTARQNLGGDYATEAQKDLYAKIRAYGKAAKAVLAPTAK